MYVATGIFRCIGVNRIIVKYDFVVSCVILDWKVRLPFRNFPHTIFENNEGGLHTFYPTNARQKRITSCICSEYVFGDNCHNKVQFGVRLAKKPMLKKGVVPTVYPANDNMTRPPPITGTTLSAPVGPVIRKREAHSFYLET